VVEHLPTKHKCLVQTQYNQKNEILKMSFNVSKLKNMCQRSYLESRHNFVSVGILVGGERMNEGD
jgi:hypothetical protein